MSHLDKLIESDWERDTINKEYITVNMLFNSLFEIVGKTILLCRYMVQ